MNAAPPKRRAWQIAFDREASVVDVKVIPPTQAGGALKLEATAPDMQCFVAAHTPDDALAIANRTNPYPNILKYTANHRTDLDPIATMYPSDAEIPLPDVLSFGVALRCWYCDATVTNANTINPVWETDDDGAIVGVYCAECSAEYLCDSGADHAGPTDAPVAGDNFTMSDAPSPRELEPPTLIESPPPTMTFHYQKESASPYGTERVPIALGSTASQLTVTYEQPTGDRWPSRSDQPA